MSSLLGDLNAVDSSLTSANLNANNNSDRTILKLPLNRVKLDPQNVRLEYDQDYVKELANTILRDGLLQPISVRADSDSLIGKYTSWTYFSQVTREFRL
ncbi:hypothetical protein A7A55_00190 [Acinetobacter baumannii]|nr:hypothetical protein A7A55_00190 [Acinetobacter baumannii]